MQVKVYRSGDDIYLDYGDDNLQSRPASDVGFEQKKYTDSAGNPIVLFSVTAEGTDTELFGFVEQYQYTDFTKEDGTAFASLSDFDAYLKSLKTTSTDTTGGGGTTTPTEPNYDFGFTLFNISQTANTGNFYSQANGSNGFSSLKIPAGANGNVRQTYNSSVSNAAVLSLSDNDAQEASTSTLRTGIYSFDSSLAYILNGTPASASFPLQDGDVLELEKIPSAGFAKINYNLYRNGVKQSTNISQASFSDRDLYLKLYFVGGGNSLINLSMSVNGTVIAGVQ